MDSPFSTMYSPFPKVPQVGSSMWTRWHTMRLNLSWKSPSRPPGGKCLSLLLNWKFQVPFELERPQIGWINHNKVQQPVGPWSRVSGHVLCPERPGVSWHFSKPPRGEEQGQGQGREGQVQVLWRLPRHWWEPQLQIQWRHQSHHRIAGWGCT